jgi:CobQ-like glutamine amidotransferase family enzyme
MKEYTMKRTAFWFGGIIILVCVLVPMMSYATPAFLVRGLVTDANNNRIDGLDVTVENTSRSIPAMTGRTGESGNGIYSVFFFSLSGAAAESGDEIQVTVEQEGEVVAEATYILTDDDIEAASAVIDIQIESRVPAPILDSAASDSGIITGGKIVQLLGENFQEGASVIVAGNAILEVDFVSPTELTITIPEGAAGVVEIVLTNPDGQSDTIVIEIEPRVPAPILDSAASDSGIITGGKIVQLLGENFQEGASVIVAGNAILEVDFVSPTELTITIPEGAAGVVEIVLTNPDGQSDTIVIEIEPRVPAPILDSAASDSGIITGGKIVQLLGENFQEGASVTVGGNEILEVDFVSPTELTITIPEGAAGVVEIVLTNPDGQSDTIVIEIEPRVPAPILDSAASDSGIITGGKIVQLLGENFQEGASVIVAGNAILEVCKRYRRRQRDFGGGFCLSNRTHHHNPRRRGWGCRNCTHQSGWAIGGN